MKNGYRVTIGMEVHVELKTKTKMFCDSLNNTEEKKPNTNICPICVGHPGTLPVINKEAVVSVIKTGLALNCRVAEKTWFERKNYFYPDLPKGYQISQYETPLCGSGRLKIGNKEIGIERIHLEEDTGRLIHPKGADYSLVDYNRAGIPLMELVTEPDIASGKEAREFCEEFQLILRYLRVAEANMEKGEMRCEVNISLSKTERKGTKVEIKNLNSFKSVEKAVDYEIERQSTLLDSGDKIVQETRGWNEKKQITFPQRTKEGSADYRYFPEPDLPPFSINHSQSFAKGINIAQIRLKMPELPAQKRERFKKEFSLPDSDIITLVNSRSLGDYFEKVHSELSLWERSVEDEEKTAMSHLPKLAKLAANYLITEVQKLLYESKQRISDIKINAEDFAEFITLIHKGEISSSAAQEVLKEMFKSGKDPSNIIDEKGLKQVSDAGELEAVAEKIIKNNPNPVSDFKKGKQNALQFLVGQVMKESKGKANPQVAAEILKKLLF